MAGNIGALSTCGRHDRRKSNLSAMSESMHADFLTGSSWKSISAERYGISVISTYLEYIAGGERRLRKGLANQRWSADVDV